MRRCGKASCLVLIGVLAAATVASGAFAARGGRQGVEHGKAKGHSKHAVAAPLLSSQTAKPGPSARAERPSVTRLEKKHAVSPPGAQVRHNHMTICHHTGSGYIVISPSIRGALRGHLPHGDFPYVDGCRAPLSRPMPSPAPDPSPKLGVEGTTAGSASSQASGSVRELPFTGLPVGWIAGAGALLLACGLALRKTARS